MLAVVWLCRPLYGYVSHCMGCCRLTHGVFKWQLCHSMLIMLIMLRCKFFFYSILSTIYIKILEPYVLHVQVHLICVLTESLLHVMCQMSDLNRKITSQLCLPICILLVKDKCLHSNGNNMLHPLHKLQQPQQSCT